MILCILNSRPTAFLLTESLRDTVARVDACWSELIAPKVMELGTVLIAAHGNSLRDLP